MAQAAPAKELQGKGDSSVVRGDWMKVRYVKPHYDIEAGGRRTVALEISLPLTEEHEGLLPDLIEAEWEHYQEGGCASIKIDGIPNQKMTLGFQAEDHDLEIDVVVIEDATLSTVLEKGSGDAVEVTRLKFRAVAALTPAVAKFADFQFSNDIWIMLNDSQKALFPDKD
jgi:hypothetical protein